MYPFEGPISSAEGTDFCGRAILLMTAFDEPSITTMLPESVFATYINPLFLSKANASGTLSSWMLATTDPLPMLATFTTPDPESPTNTLPWTGSSATESRLAQLNIKPQYEAF